MLIFRHELDRFPYIFSRQAYFKPLDPYPLLCYMISCVIDELIFHIKLHQPPNYQKNKLLIPAINHIHISPDSGTTNLLSFSTQARQDNNPQHNFLSINQLFLTLKKKTGAEQKTTQALKFPVFSFAFINVYILIVSPLYSFSPI
jgi:hypothetical protein